MKPLAQVLEEVDLAVETRNLDAISILGEKTTLTSSASRSATSRRASCASSSPTAYGSSPDDTELLDTPSCAAVGNTARTSVAKATSHRLLSTFASRLRRMVRARQTRPTRITLEARDRANSVAHRNMHDRAPNHGATRATWSDRRPRLRRPQPPMHRANKQRSHRHP